MNIPEDMIGGARVMRRIERPELKAWLAGTELTAEQVRTIPLSNRRALIDNGHIVVMPRAVLDQTRPANAIPVEAAEPVERFHVHEGGGRWSVYEGRKLNENPLSKDEAEALAAGLPQKGTHHA